MSVTPPEQPLYGIEVPWWYTREELAARWHVSAKTVSNWLWRARVEGFTPHRAQYRRQSRSHGKGCIVLIRADFANALFKRVRKF